jgi:hypothetical protein
MSFVLPIVQVSDIAGEIFRIVASQSKESTFQFSNVDGLIRQKTFGFFTTEYCADLIQFYDGRYAVLVCPTFEEMQKYSGIYMWARQSRNWMVAIHENDAWSTDSYEHHSERSELADEARAVQHGALAAFYSRSFAFQTEKKVQGMQVQVRAIPSHER